MWLNLVPICSYGLYLAERTVQPELFSHFQNCLWNVCITASTVGYGDTFPISNFGRSISVFAAWLGIILGALVVALTVQALELRQTEKDASYTFEKIESEHKMMVVAATILQTAFRRNQWRKETRNDHSISATHRWQKESHFSRKLGFLFYKLRAVSRELAVLTALNKSDNVSFEILSLVKKIDKRLNNVESSMHITPRVTPFEKAIKEHEEEVKLRASTRAQMTLSQQKQQQEKQQEK